MLISFSVNIVVSVVYLQLLKLDKLCSALGIMKFSFRNSEYRVLNKHVEWRQYSSIKVGCSFRKNISSQGYLDC